MASTAELLARELGAERVVAEGGIEPYRGDESGLRGEPDAVVVPATTEEVAAVMRLSAAEKLVVVPRGAGSGKVGGCVPTRGGVVLDLSKLTGLSIVLENDATAACVAEQLLGRGHELHDFAYFFLGSFVGGGLVLNGKVVSGRTHNAAALGPLPVPDGTGGTVQLLDVASLHVLESALHRAGQNSEVLRQQDVISCTA